MKNLRKTFFGSVVSLLICFTMLLGTTFAWFTDSVSSVGNKIIAGTLDIELHQYVYDEATDTWSWKDISAVTDPLFDYDLWEPGYTEYVVLKVVNNGNLALKWKATFSSTNVLSELANVINVYVHPTAPAAEGTYNNLNAPANRAEALAYTSAGTVKSFVDQIEDVTKGELKANEEACLTLVLQMDPNAGNDYMNLDLGGAFDISIVATQNTVESDDFGTDYDADAVYPGCEHTSTSTTTTYNKTANGHTAVTTEKCNDCHAVIGTTYGTEEAHIDTNSDNVCDTCGYGMTPAPTPCNHVDANHDGECDLGCGETGLAVSHDGETINYTYNNDGTHTGVYACGVTAVTNEACVPADGVCAKCNHDKTPVVPAVTTLVSYDFDNYDVTTNQWQNHYGGHHELSVVDGRLHLEKTDQNIMYSLWTTLPTLTKDETYTISADIYLCDNEYIDGESKTLDSATFTAFVKFNDADGEVLAKSEGVTVAYGAAETVTFTYTPDDNTSTAVLSFNMDGDSWSHNGVSFCIDNVKVTVEGDDATLDHSNLSFIPNYDGTHKIKCSCGEIIKASEACSDPDWDNDTLCDKCGYDMAPAVCNHVDADHNGVCDNGCGATNLEIHDFTNGNCSCGLSPINFNNFNDPFWSGATIDSNHVISYPAAWKAFGWRVDEANGITGASSATITFAGTTVIPVNLATKYSDGSEGLVFCPAGSSSVTINLVPNKTLTELKLVNHDSGSISLAEISVDFKTPVVVESWDNLNVEFTGNETKTVLTYAELGAALDQYDDVPGAILHIVSTCSDSPSHGVRYGHSREGMRTTDGSNGCIFSIFVTDLLALNYDNDPAPDLKFNANTNNSTYTISRVYITVPSNN